MNIGILIIFIFFGLILYFLLARGPSSDLVFTSNSEAEITTMEKYLAANGVKTYIKNKDVQRLVLDGALGNPTLHVVDMNDYRKAIALIQSHKSRDATTS
jgi:hypothetical protein